ncbi:MAG: choice-of-anchor I family protein [Acidobacteria bacterium]|nr:choice-of-anchor I family protein [Acidobacteriota bacterium]
MSKLQRFCRSALVPLFIAVLAIASPAGAGVVVGLDLVGRYDSGLGEAAAEIVAYDAASKRAFVINAEAVAVDIVDIALPTAPKLVRRVDLTSYGAGANSVDVAGGIVAVAVQADPKTDPGTLVFLDVDGAPLGSVQVGALPDMVAFTPDGQRVLVANEGEPNDDYDVDPEGSVSIVDLASGVGSAQVSTATFTDFNVGGPRAAELPADVRIFGPGATVAQDLEPEYIAIAPSGTVAYVTLQEANAVAAIDVASAQVIKIVSLGFKDHSLPGNGLDPSDRDDGAAIANWPVRGLFMPDSIAIFTGADDELYLATANEGDSRDYDGFSEEERIKDLDLDPIEFPDAAALQADEALGRLKTTSTLGDTDGDGDWDVLYSYGARSFSLWNATTGAQVYDSGDQFEQITLALVPQLFNSQGDPDSFDSRSDDKGPEPEALATGSIDGRRYAFVGLERTGGVFVYDVTEPAAAEYVAYRPTDGVDISPEGFEFVPAESSPTGRPLLLAAHEVSGTLAIFQARLGDGEGSTCLADGSALCLNQGRFQVQATWRAFDGSSGYGHAVPLTEESGYFWFFSETNVELVVKVLNACTPEFDRYWVFASGLTNVEVELTVLDSETGTSQVYRNEPGSGFELITDTSTFDVCP